jgi:hypothetical protein
MMENQRNDWKHRLKALFGRARSEAGDFAETAMLKVEIARLARRRDGLFRTIGARVFEKSRTASPVAGFEAEVAEVREIEERIALKESAMATAGRSAGAEPETAGVS